MFYKYSVLLTLRASDGHVIQSDRIDVEASSAGQAARLALDGLRGMTHAETTHIYRRGDLHALPRTVTVRR